MYCYSTAVLTSVGNLCLSGGHLVARGQPAAAAESEEGLSVQSPGQKCFLLCPWNLQRRPLTLSDSLSQVVNVSTQPADLTSQFWQWTLFCQMVKTEIWTLEIILP